ncbi:hypothetical protein PV328_005922 [Microctonus aethiopoides]|uniref:Copper transport protein n=1 Tax=Microctonus aethiopoides TaxID=144406 RepID=A0AA39FNH0_9HYME|nr:hypothetical protein PV328_005922 [Microctonus aethiopoides]
MSHDHMAHMMNASGGHGAHEMHHGMDHSTMNHATMDHDSKIGHQMGHGVDTMTKAGDMCGEGGHGMMMMAFHGGYCETILFETWKTSSIGGLIGSMIGIIIMASLYEGLKYYREYLFWKTYNALQYRSVTMPAGKNVVAEDNRVVHMVGEVIHKQP